MKIELHDMQYSHPGSRHGIHLPELSLASGETLAVVGPSGCGKTTFLNLLSALLQPDAGKILVGDTRLDTLSRQQAQRYRAETIGYIFQDFGLLDYLSARDNILHPFRIVPGRRISQALHEEVDALAKDLGIFEQLPRRPARLSHGERQRVAICRAMVTRPVLMLADEPTGNLDPESAARVMDILFNARQRLDATLIMVTHDHGLLDRFDRVIDFREHWGEVA